MDIDNREDLVRAVEQGFEPRFVFFWGHTGRPDTIGKFNQNPALGAYLMTTGDKVLVEASPKDRVWGIGLAASAPEASDPARWPGDNLLGFALMRVRRRLAETGEP